MARMAQQVRDPNHSLSRDPCPAADGTVFNAMVDFKVACGVDMPKGDLAQVVADNFTHCMDICISWHPKCVGFGFDALGASNPPGNPDNCWPKKLLAPTVTQKYILDSAMATNLPIAADDCGKLGSVYSAKVPGGGPDQQFQVHCGKYYAPGSLAEVQASSMVDCMDKCVQYNNDHSTKCVGVAYEATQDYGYLNCYFKRAVEQSAMAPNPNYKFDMAIAVANTQNGAGSVANTAAPAGPTASSTVPQTVDASSVNSQSNGQGTSGSYLPSWVIGAILGPILALLLAGFIALYFWQKRRSFAKAINGFVSGQQCGDPIYGSPSVGSV
ncbi:hypothetical protein PG985_012002 [Apiospora marii]|uniref:Apple domain-containing protein n=1 Tax=Apiospora marii TaxID=335849 RepID=A0ABR1REI9_9PEZI